MIYSDIFRLENLGLGQDGGDHIFGLFATLGQILPERSGGGVGDFLSVDENVGVGAGGFFAQVNDFFTANDQEGQGQEKKQGFDDFGGGHFLYINSIQRRCRFLIVDLGLVKCFT